MCTNPKTISVKVSPIAPHYMKLPAVLAGLKVVTVPCGSCPECMKKKQDGFTQRVYRAVQDYRFAWFVTLTYNDRHLPVSINLVKHTVDFDLDTGEIYDEFDNWMEQRILKDSELLSTVRAGLLAQKAGAKPRYYSMPIPFNLPDCPYQYRYEFTFSLCRHDVQYWLKRCGIEYKRQFGKNLPKFKRLICGEMGPKTCRPHYHCLFLSNEETFDNVLNWMLKYWYDPFTKKGYGFWQKKRVSKLNENNTDGVLAVATYISKYISKGKYECDSVKERKAERGRLCASINLGAESFPGPLRSWYLGFDLFGRYDLNTLRLEGSGRKLSDEQITKLCDRINSRCVISLPGREHPFRMCKYLLEKIFSYNVQFNDSQIKKKAWYYIWFLASARLQDVLYASEASRLREALQGVPEEEVHDAIIDFYRAEETRKKNRSSRIERDTEQFYSQTVF